LPHSQELSIWQKPLILQNIDMSSNIGLLNTISFEVKLPSACIFIVDGLAFCCRCSDYMFRPTWPSLGVYDISLFSPEGICFCCLCCMLYYAVSNLCGGLNVMYYYLLYLCTLLFCYSIYVFYLLVFACCVSVNFLILVCVFGFLAFPCCLSGLCCYLLVISCIY
jgi:hypothetical protein